MWINRAVWPALDRTTVLHPENGTDVNVTFHAELQGGNLPDPEYDRHRFWRDVTRFPSASVRSGEYDGNRWRTTWRWMWTPVRTAPLNFMYTATYTKDDGLPYW